ncbi:hypothetical protein STCU_06152 [Strigomonas culicis]|nr:hypothetical protein STCU_06152 [Strigomonas culicis]|eukprot:EPY26643.1 hypothetical protein STCU_06152 [Strigomonas culicis]
MARAAQHPLSAFEQMPNLRKLSISECGVSSMPERWFLPLLTELRLAHNQLRSFQPEGVILRSLKILDVSHNELTDACTLRRCRFVRQVNVHGNPFATAYEAQDRASGIIPAETAGAVSSSLHAQLARVLQQVEMIDGHALLPEEERRRLFVEASKRARTREEEDRKRAKEEEAPPLKKQKVDPTLIAAEAEEKDVVMEVPESVIKKASTPIVRRGRMIKAAAPQQVKREGGAAVASILKRKESTPW